MKFPAKKEIEKLHDLIDITAKNGGYIAGGAVRYIADVDAFFCGEGKNRSPRSFWSNQNASKKKTESKRPSDVDIFCYDEDSYFLLISALKIKYKAHLATKDTRYSTTALIFNVPKLGFNEGDEGFENPLSVQIIKPLKGKYKLMYGTPHEVLDTFDFSVVKAYINNNGEVIVNNFFGEDEYTKSLRLTSAIRSPAAVFLRIQKYLNMGYMMNEQEITKLLLAFYGVLDNNRHIVDTLLESYSTKLKEEEKRVIPLPPRAQDFTAVNHSASSHNRLPISQSKLSPNDSQRMYELFWGLDDFS